MLQLEEDVLLREYGEQLSAPLCFGMQRFSDSERGVRIGQPACDGGHRLYGVGTEQCFHGAAVRVTADDNVLFHLQRTGDRELDHGTVAAQHFAIGWNHVADVAQDEDLTGSGLEEFVRIDAGVGTGNEKSVRALGFGGGTGVHLGALRVHVRAELAHSGLQLYPEPDPCGSCSPRAT